MKIYTGFGDKGYTALLGGEKVKKSSERVELYGTIDELNSLLGIVRAKSRLTEVKKIISVLQNDLFNLSTEIAAPAGKMPSDVKPINLDDIAKLEEWIDKLNAQLPTLKRFILPGGSESASFIHLARTIARRTERLLVRFMENENIRIELLIYLNRLSDLLFVMARFENLKAAVKEIFWHS